MSDKLLNAFIQYREAGHTELLTGYRDIINMVAESQKGEDTLLSGKIPSCKLARSVTTIFTGGWAAVCFVQPSNR